MSNFQTQPERSVRLFSFREIQREFSISRPTITRLISSGCLKSVRLGRTIRIPEVSLLEFIAGGGQREIQIDQKIKA